jgi:hypothetical protein
LQISFLVKSLNRCSVEHRKIVSPIIMHVACSSVNCGLKENPSLVKNQQIFLGL